LCKNSCRAYHTVVSAEVGWDTARDNSIRREQKYSEHSSLL